MMKKLSAIGLIAGLCLFGACKKSQDYGGAKVQQMANGWWVLAYSSKTGPIVIPPPASWDTASNHIFFTTYNTSADSANELWVDDLQNIGGNYDVKAVLNVNLSGYTMNSSGAANLYGSANSVTWANGKIFPKGGVSRTGVVCDSIFVQFLMAANPGDTITFKGVSRTGFDGDDWPVSPYTPTP